MRGSLLNGLSGISGPPADTRRSISNLAIELRIPLRTITPVMGGGVEARHPDEVDVVRVPGIRGQLRHFWRLVEDDAGSPYELEREFWGGVSDDGGQQRAKAGRLRVAVQVRELGRMVPAGWHEMNPKGFLRALPNWSGDRNLGYALFPLQRTRDEMRAAQQHKEGRVPTHQVREGLEFDLSIRVEDARDSQIERLLRSLWVFVHIGGIGARTTRGFGALAVRTGKGEIEVAGRWKAAWKRDWEARFRPPPSDPKGLAEWLHVARSWGVLARCDLLMGPATPTADRAHGLLVGTLREFRQAPGVGRRRKPDGREGESHWPEAHALRLFTEESGYRGSWDHPPPRDRMAAYLAGGDWTVPRAAFGLPIQVSFKDQNDSNANGVIRYTDGKDPKSDRWQSPLLLRPVACSNGRECLPLALLLAARVPNDQVKIQLSGEARRSSGRAPKTGAETRSSNGSATPSVDGSDNGAMAPIRGYLDRAGGDGLEAFLLFLAEKSRFQRIWSPGGRP